MTAATPFTGTDAGVGVQDVLHRSCGSFERRACFTALSSSSTAALVSRSTRRNRSRNSWRLPGTHAYSLLQGADDETVSVNPRHDLPSSAKIGPLLDGRFHGAFLQCAQECAHALVTISMRRIVEPIACQGISGKAAVFQTGIIVNSPSLEIFAGSASALAAYTYRTTVRWPSGRRRRFAKAATHHRTGLKSTISGPFFIGRLVGVGCRLMVLGPGLGTLAGTPRPTPMCAYQAHIVLV
jgi:hypothetical protein